MQSLQVSMVRSCYTIDSGLEKFPTETITQIGDVISYPTCYLNFGVTVIILKQEQTDTCGGIY